MKEYELYHHGVKGQKWGVRRQEKKQRKMEKRNQKAIERIAKHNTKSAATVATIGKGTLRGVGAAFLTSGAASTLALSMMALNPPAASTIAFAATAAAGLTNAGYQIGNIYKTGRDVYDIAKQK